MATPAFGVTSQHTIFHTIDEAFRASITFLAHTKAFKTLKKLAVVFRCEYGAFYSVISGPVGSTLYLFFCLRS